MANTLVAAAAARYDPNTCSPMGGRAGRKGGAMAGVKAVPDEYPQVVPYLIVDGAPAAIDFYTNVLGATERMRMPGPDGRIGHAELAIGRGMIMLADEFPDMGQRSP